MPANVETMMSGRGITPWHSLGNVVQGTPNSAEAIKLAGLDWEVEKHPIFARIPNKGDEEHGKFKRVDSLFATVRSDTQKPLGVVGSQFVPTQNRDIFSALDSLVEDGLAQYETAGSLGGGEEVWMLMVADGKIKIAGDVIRPYFLAHTGHDGSKAATFRACHTRVVCANTLAQAMGEKLANYVSIRHTTSAKSRMIEALKALTLVRNSNASFVAVADQLLAQPYSRKNFEALVAYIMPPPDPADPATTDRQAKSWMKRFEEIVACYNAPDLENVKGTAWQALNAIADYEQHTKRVTGTDVDKLETLFKRSFLEPTLSQDAFAFLTATA